MSEVRKNFYRSNDNRVFGGVCGALAERYGLDVFWVRAIAVLVQVFFFQLLFVAYVAFILIVPSEPEPELDEFQRDIRYGSNQRQYHTRRLNDDFDEMESRLQRIEDHVAKGRHNLDQEIRSMG